ncbi:MAG: RnfABCDGE type electron transport complex subunit D [Promethearchaeia archaeon]
MNEKKYTVEYNKVDPPNLHIGFTKNDLMLRTFLLLCIIGFASVIIMGLTALIHILIALGTVLIVHNIIFSYQKWKDLPVTYKSPASHMVAGMVLGLAMPIAAPYEVTAAVAILMVFVFKYGQSKFFTRKYLNPAAASKVILLVLLSVFVLFEDPLSTGLIFHPHHLELTLSSPQGFKGAMWIFQGETLLFTELELSATESLLFWQTHGWIGGACGLLVLGVGLFATYWLKYKWRIIGATLGTMSLLAVGWGLILGGDPILRLAFHVFTGSVIFLVFFMATEPQSTPMPEKSQYIFGVLLAILTFILQLFNVLGGSIIALVILNIATPFLDKIGIKTPYGHRESNGGA